MTNPTEGNLLAHMADVLVGHKTFDLKVVSWREFRYGASYGGGRADHNHLDDLQIEVHCRSQGGTLAEGATTVGGNPPQDMHGLRFTIVLRSARKLFATFDGDACARYRGAWQGHLQYFEPIEPDHPWSHHDHCVVAGRPGPASQVKTDYCGIRWFWR
jgi:hypothetical protein